LTDPEILRKLANLIALFIPIVYYFVPTGIGKYIMLLIALVFLIIDLARLKLSLFKDIFVLVFGSSLRKHEVWSVTGATYLVMGALISVLLFPKMIAIAALLYVIVGDTFAAVIGLKFGTLKLFRKSLVGSLSFLVVSVVIAHLLSILPPDPLPFKVGFVGAAVAALIEALPLNLDDNFAVPIVAGAIMTFVA